MKKLKSEDKGLFRNVCTCQVGMGIAMTMIGAVLPQIAGEYGLDYSFSGLMAGLAGITIASRLYSGTCTSGESAEMDAIAAVVVGGTSMSGGRGSLVGAFLGMLIIGVMNNILNTVGVPTFLCDAVKGLIIIFAVLLQKKESA